MRPSEWNDFCAHVGNYAAIERRNAIISVPRRVPPPNGAPGASNSAHAPAALFQFDVWETRSVGSATVRFQGRRGQGRKRGWVHTPAVGQGLTLVGIGEGSWMRGKRITVMGSFVADLAFRTERLPGWGETFMGSSFKLGPGGKGSNQAVAAARAGARVSFIGKVGNDPFGDLARRTYLEEKIDTRHLLSSDLPTGAAAILIDGRTGENSIIVVPGASLDLRPDEIDGMKDLIAQSAIFVTQLELSLLAVQHGLKLARSLGVQTILNPAPGCKLPEAMFQDCDYVTPNESETEILTGIRVRTAADAEQAADALLALGVRNAVITLGAQGAFAKSGTAGALIPAYHAGPVMETTGAGDAFNGGFAVALAEGRDLIEAARFGCAVAGLSVTRAGTAPSMPYRAAVDALMQRG